MPATQAAVSPSRGIRATAAAASASTLSLTDAVRLPAAAALDVHRLTSRESAGRVGLAAAVSPSAGPAARRLSPAHSWPGGGTGFAGSLFFHPSPFAAYPFPGSAFSQAAYRSTSARTQSRRSWGNGPGVFR